MPWSFNSLLPIAVAFIVGLVLGAVYAWRQSSAFFQGQAATLRQDHEWFRTTLAHIRDAVLASNADGKVTFLNAAAENLTGWKQQEARGKPLEEVYRSVDSKTRQPVENAAVCALRGGGAVATADFLMLIAKDGAEKFVGENAAAIRDENEVVIGVVLVFRPTGERTIAVAPPPS